MVIHAVVKRRVSKSSAGYFVTAWCCDDEVGLFGAAFVWAAVPPAYAESDITLSGNAAFLTQYVDRGITNSAERPAVQAEFDLYYKEIYYAGIWGIQRELRFQSERTGSR